MKKFGFITFIVLLFSVSMNAQNENTLSKEDKLYELSVLWKEVSYNFAFFDQVPYLNWDSCYQSFMPQVLGTSSDWEYYLVLQRFMALLQDGHTRIFPPASLRNKYYGSAREQIKTRLIENKVIITGVMDNSLVDAGIRQGMEILSIDNVDVHDYARKYVAPYMYASTPQDLTLQTYGHFLLSGSVEEPAMIQVRDFNDNTQTVAIHRQPWLMEIEIFKGEPLAFEVLANKIGYLKINNFVDTEEFRPKFDSIYALILKTDGLIIDVRDNFGGATQITQYVLKHFTNEKIQTVNWKSPMYIAAHKAWNMNKDWLEVDGYEIEPFKDKTIYTKPVNVLADESSFSGAEDFCVGFKMMKRGKLIGNKTAGSTGSPLMFNLPDGALVLICTKKDLFPDGTEFIGYGIEPDIKVPVSIEDVRNDKDAALIVAMNDLVNR